MDKMMICPKCWGSKTFNNTTCTSCNGSGHCLDVQLSEHFMLSEMLTSQTAVRLELSNEPDSDTLEHLKHVCSSLLEPIRAKFGAVHVDSGYRSTEVNKAVGGVGTSAHCFGLAADINVKSASRKEVVEWIVANINDFDQVIFEGTWVHIAHSPKLESRKQALMMFKGHYFIFDPNDPRVNT